MATVKGVSVLKMNPSGCLINADTVNNCVTCKIRRALSHLGDKVGVYTTIPARFSKKVSSKCWVWLSVTPPLSSWCLTRG